MRLQLSLALLFGALCACELPLPEGSYVADANTGPLLVGEDAGRPEGGVVVVPGGDTGSPSPTGTGGGADAGAGGTPGVADAGSVNNQALLFRQRLAGRYFVRMDMKSTTSVMATSLIEIRARNRVSHLVLAELKVEGDQLKADERFCYQTFAHRCEEGCDQLTTTMNESALKELTQLQQTRNYRIAGMNLTGEKQTLYLGFDASKDPTLPSQASDPRVWDLIEGNTLREGMLLTLDTTGIKRVHCEVYNVQSFDSSFDGVLGGSADQPTLKGKTFTLVSSAKGTTLGASHADCRGGGNDSTSKGAETVRFDPVLPGEFEDATAFWGCPPASEWDRRLAPPAP